MPTLTAENLGQYYGPLLLFRHLSFVMDETETMAITGANGAGKSTLLRILAGVLRPKAGDVRLQVGKETIAREDHPHRVGLVAPYLGLYGTLTARENLSFLATARRLEAPRRRIASALERVGLAERADDRVSTFSSGMRQRVKYAAAILPRPSVLFLDEPSANLDSAGRDMVEAIVREQRDRDGLVIVATNREDEAARHDRTLRIEDHR